MFWWLQPEWKEALCANCGAKIWPEGDPDWGYCWQCYSTMSEEQEHPIEPFPDDDWNGR